MNYEKIYNQIVIKAQNRVLDKIIYTERHHIIPKCLGGVNSKENRIIVTAKEHYLLHYLLVKIYPDHVGLIHAFWMMCNGSRKQRPNTNSRMYATARELFTKMRKGVSSVMKGKTHTQETKDKISKSKQGHDFWTGKKHTEESKLKMAIAATGRKLSDETVKKFSEIKKGLKYSDEHKANISKAKIGDKNPMFGKTWKVVNGKRIYYDKER